MLFQILLNSCLLFNDFSDRNPLVDLNYILKSNTQNNTKNVLIYFIYLLFLKYY